MQFDGAAVRADVEREKLSYALACRPDVALLAPRAPAHHLMGQHPRETLQSFWVFFKNRYDLAFRINTHSRIGVGDCIAMILTEKQRSLGERFGRAHGMQHALPGHRDASH